MAARPLWFYCARRLPTSKARVCCNKTREAAQTRPGTAAPKSYPARPPGAMHLSPAASLLLLLLHQQCAAATVTSDAEAQAAAYASADFVAVIVAVGASAALLLFAACLLPLPRRSACAVGSADLLAPPPFSSLTWRDVCVEARTLRLRHARPLLRGVSGTLRRGELVALLGPSGSGKSTLLRVLGGEPPARGLHAAGDMRLDGAPAPPPLRRRALGYVPQHDALPGWLTTAEAVTFGAALRLPPSTQSTAAAAATAACAELGLKAALHTRVAALSGGELRRAAIAAELAVAPAVLLCDECTSGLDAYHALALLRSLRGLAAGGRAVLVAIHTPGAEAFALFDRALLLVDGRTVWAGPTPSADGGDALRALFARGAPCPAERTLAEHLLFRAVAPAAAAPLDAEAAVDGAEGAVAHWDDSDVAAATAAAFASAQSAEAPAEASPTTAPPSAPPGAPLLLQLRWLFWREALRVRRAPALLVAHVLLALGLGVWLGVVYYKLDLTIYGFQSRLGVVFFVLASFGFSALSAAGAFAADAPLLAQEAHRAVHPAAFAAARVAADLLLLRAAPVALHVAVLYYMVGFQPEAERFFTFFAAVLLHALAAAALAALVSAASPGQGVAVLLASFLSLQMAVFGGLLTSTARLPTWLSWLRFTSLNFFAFEAAVSNEFSGLTFLLGIAGIDGIAFSGDTLLSSALALAAPRVGADLACLAAWLLFFVAATCAVVAAKHRPRGA